MQPTLGDMSVAARSLLRAPPPALTGRQQPHLAHSCYQGAPPGLAPPGCPPVQAEGGQAGGVGRPGPGHQAHQHAAHTDIIYIVCAT